MGAYNVPMLTADRRALLPFVLAFTAVASACQSKPAAPPPPVSEDVWAVVDGREIRREEIEKAYRRTAQPNPAISEDEATTAKLNLLAQVITQDILLAKATELQIVLPESELDTAFTEGRKNIADDAFNKELSSRNLTVADMREGLRRDIIAQKVIEREVTSKITVTDQDINDFFQANKAQFNLAEDSFRIAQIVVTPVRDAELNNRTGDDATTVQAATAKVQMLMERLKGGTAFSELATDYSEDPQSAPQGGDVGLVPVSALRQAPPQLRDAVTKTQPGSVNVVSMEGGHTIVALVAKQAAGQRDPSMPEVREGITATLRGRREQLLRTAYLEAIRNRATVVNHVARRIGGVAGATGTDARGGAEVNRLNTPPLPRLRQGSKLSAVRVETEDLSLLDHVVPGVETQLAALDAIAHGRKTHESLELQHERPHLCLAKVVLRHLRVDDRGSGKLQPSVHVGRVIALGHEERPDGAAMAVPADDDVLDAEHEGRKFDPRRGPVKPGVGFEGRHQVAHVADHEEISGKGVCEQVGDHPGIRAPQEQRAGRLAFGHQTLVVFAKPGKRLTAEPPETFHELLRHPDQPSNRRPPTRGHATRVYTSCGARRIDDHPRNSIRPLRGGRVLAPTCLTMYIRAHETHSESRCAGRRRDHRGRRDSDRHGSLWPTVCRRRRRGQRRSHREGRHGHHRGRGPDRHNRRPDRCGQ